MPKKHPVYVIFILSLLALVTSCSIIFADVAHTSPSIPLTVTFIDAGQADCTLVQDREGTLLIDAGTNAGSEKLVSVLRRLGVAKINILVGTHPHEDHIGGLDSVIQNFSVGAVYLPDVTSSTRTYSDVLDAIAAKGLKISVPKPGDAFTLERAAGVFLAPQEHEYDEINDYSIVIRLEYGRHSFLFTGDAQTQSEREMMAAGYRLKSTVLKVGHHGSESSTSAAFLEAVSPTYAVISVGSGNDYGHPHSETLHRLAEAAVRVSRTDLNGSITFSSDGAALKVRTGR